MRKRLCNFVINLIFLKSERYVYTNIYYLPCFIQGAYQNWRKNSYASFLVKFKADQVQKDDNLLQFLRLLFTITLQI